MLPGIQEEVETKGWGDCRLGGFVAWWHGGLAQKGQSSAEPLRDCSSLGPDFGPQVLFSPLLLPDSLANISDIKCLHHGSVRTPLPEVTGQPSSVGCSPGCLEVRKGQNHKHSKTPPIPAAWAALPSRPWFRSTLALLAA